MLWSNIALWGSILVCIKLLVSHVSESIPGRLAWRPRWATRRCCWLCGPTSLRARIVRHGGWICWWKVLRCVGVAEHRFSDRASFIRAAFSGSFSVCHSTQHFPLGHRWLGSSAWHRCNRVRYSYTWVRCNSTTVHLDSTGMSERYQDGSLTCTLDICHLRWIPNRVSWVPLGWVHWLALHGRIYWPPCSCLCPHHGGLVDGASHPRHDRLCVIVTQLTHAGHCGLSGFGFRLQFGFAFWCPWLFELLALFSFLHFLFELWVAPSPFRSARGRWCWNFPIYGFWATRCGGGWIFPLTWSGDAGGGWRRV